MYLYVWQFEVAPDDVAEFERIYGADGPWVELFRRAPGYRSTCLIASDEQPSRYVTLDQWESRAHYDTFRRDFAEEFERLDQQCESLTVREKNLLELEGREVSRLTAPDETPWQRTYGSTRAEGPPDKTDVLSSRPMDEQGR